MITSVTNWIGRDQCDKGQFTGLIESKDLPNAMIRIEILRRIGLFHEKEFPMVYHEADFGERVRKLGYRIVCNPKAKMWHDVPPPEAVKSKARLYHVDYETRAYYSARNRIIFSKKYSKFYELLVFLLFFSWPISVYYLFQISRFASSNKSNIMRSYLRGYFDGILHKSKL